MSKTRWAVRLLPIALLATAALTGCASVASEPPPETRGRCDTARNSVSVMINATSEATIDNSFPKTHEVEVCKGKQSIVWYAENGTDLGITVDPAKAITPGRPRGHFAGRVDCGNVIDPKSNATIASTCVATVLGNSGSGNVAYTLTVSPKSTGRPYPVDPQMIIQP